LEAQSLSRGPGRAPSPYRGRRVRDRRTAFDPLLR
jgi:hypothetical protein